MAQKTLVDLAEILLAKKRTWNIDMNLKLVISGTEIGAIAVTGKIDMFQQIVKVKLQNSIHREVALIQEVSLICPR